MSGRGKMRKYIILFIILLGFIVANNQVLGDLFGPGTMGNGILFPPAGSGSSFVAGDALLLEGGDYLLLEIGDKLLLE